MQSASVESILNYWKNTLGWKRTGYHVLIEPNGLIHYLLPFDKVSNGVKGYNLESIHIAYIGGKDFDDRTEKQKESIIRAIKEALDYARPHIPIIQGHRDFGVPKLCPQFDAREEYLWLRQN
jgi:hypothetical protein